MLGIKPIDGYVDIHCHILPNCDDGADDLQAAVEMARMAYDHGTRHIIATPHTWDGNRFRLRYGNFGYCKADWLLAKAKRKKEQLI